MVWLTRHDAAARVNRSERTIRRWVATGQLRAVRGRVVEAELLETDRQVRSGGTRMIEAQERARRAAAFLQFEKLGVDTVTVEALARFVSTGITAGQIDTLTHTWAAVRTESAATVTLPCREHRHSVCEGDFCSCYCHLVEGES